MPFKDFAAGDVLTAADVDNYLMRQTVMTFADSAARTAAISTAVVVEGMVTYLADTDALEYWNGSAWTGVSNPGDITAVTAGTGLSGGGTAGDVTLSADYAAIGSAITIDNSQVAQTVQSKSTSYILVAGDAGTLIQFTAAGTVTVSDVLADGEQIDFIQHGTGQITFAGSGVTLRSVDGKLKTNTQYSAATLKKANGSYYVIGDLTT